MDEKLHILHHLYGEGEDPAELRRLLEDEALREEFEAFSDVKARLDQRERARPDPRVIDRVVAAAVPSRPGARADRAARPGRALRGYRLVGAISAALAVVLAVAVGLNQYRDVARTAPAAAESEALMQRPMPSEVSADADEPARVLDAAAPLAGRQAAPAAEEPARPADRREALAPTAAGFAAKDEAAEERADREAADPPPAWDEGDDLVRVHRRIELLRARSLEGAWDESAVMSLDSLPTQQPDAPRLDAASTRRSDGHR